MAVLRMIDAPFVVYYRNYVYVFHSFVLGCKYVRGDRLGRDGTGTMHVPRIPALTPPRCNDA